MTSDVWPQDGPLQLSVVVPAYQEAGCIDAALRRLHEAVTGRVDSYEIIVVCDGCTDGTSTVARAVGLPGIRVIDYPVNRGKGHALVTGARAARGQLVAFFDGDLDLHPRSLVAMLDILVQTGVDIVVGSKVHADSVVTYPLARRVQSAGYRRLLRTCFSLDVGDTQTGAKLFERNVLDACLPGILTEGFAFDLEVLVRAHDLGFRIAEGPVDLDYQFDTSLPLYAALAVLRDTLQIARRRRRWSPLDVPVRPLTCAGEPP